MWCAQPWLGAPLVALALSLALRDCAARQRVLPWLVAAAVGFIWAAQSSVAADSRLLRACAEGATTIVDGKIIGLPVADGYATRFELQLDDPIRLPRCGSVDPNRLRLVWFDAAPMMAGERWQFEVRLRTLRNFDNPGGFDYLAWARERGIGGAGSVRRAVRISPAGISLDRIRDEIGRAIAETSDAHAAGGHGSLYRALSLGDSRAIDDTAWELYRATGTVHLVVISGLHVAIAAALGAAIGGGIWRLLPRTRRRSSLHGASAMVGAIAATAYTALAGFELPVVRALVMAVAGLLWWCAGRQLSPLRVLLLTATALLALDPLALLDTSLWLSFGAVAVLVGYFHPRRGLAWGTLFVRAQGVLFIGLLPILVSGVGQVAWLAPLANAVAVPLVSLILVPLMLLALALMPLWVVAAGFCYAVADFPTGWLVDWLQWVSTPQWQSIWRRPSAPVVTIALTASALMLLPLSRMVRLFVVAPLMLLVLLPQHARPGWGEVRVDVLDVGQGLAVLIDTAHQRLLVDAGPKYPSGFDLGKAAVVPALHATGVAALDLFVVSHADLDHAGGMETVRRMVPTRAILAGEPTSHALPCRRGAAWQWSGVTFRVLAPAAASSGNAASCVVHIAARSGSALLPGDIGTLDERTLVSSGLPPATLLVAPHHGSRTSSSTAFLAAVSPSVIAISSGMGNSFGHPHAQVLSRYAALGARVGNTARDGALVWQSDRPLELMENVP